MEKLKEFDFNDLYIFTQDDYIKTPDTIDAIMTDIYLTHEKKDSYFNYKGAITEVNKINSLFFYTDFIDAKMYVLTNKQGKAISLAICSHEGAEDSWHIEYICTNRHYAGEGYGEILTRELAKDLQKRGAQYLTSIVHKSNTPSLYMLEAFGKNSNVRTFRSNMSNDRYKYEFDISKINESKFETEEEFGI